MEFDRGGQSWSRFVELKIADVGAEFIRVRDGRQGDEVVGAAGEFEEGVGMAEADCDVLGVVTFGRPAPLHIAGEEVAVESGGEGERARVGVVGRHLDVVGREHARGVAQGLGCHHVAQRFIQLIHFLINVVDWPPDIGVLAH